MEFQQEYANLGMTRRGLHVLFFVAFAAAIIGFFVGIDDGAPRAEVTRPERPQPVADHDGSVVPATGYTELQTTDIGPNRTWRSDLKKLAWSPPEIEDILRFAADDTAKARTVANRTLRRAYDGAPPVIPHEVDQMSSSNCLACHGEGIGIAEQYAHLMPHPYLTNCTQCHVQEASSDFELATAVENHFEGREVQIGGPRAWEGAPPQIPHTTHMRVNCTACHGPLAADGIRTSHPWRQSCVQCHTQSAELDQIPFNARPSFLPAPEIERNAVAAGEAPST